MKKIKFVPVDYDYFDFGGGNYVRMIGRDDEGRKVCVVDSYEANFYLILDKGADERAVVEEVSGIVIDDANRVSRVLRCEVLDKNFLGKGRRVVRVFVSNHKDLGKFASRTGDIEGVEFRREHDLGIVTKYIKEKGVEPLREYDVEVQEDECFAMDSGLDSFGVEEVVLARKISPCESGTVEKKFVPRVLAYDIETTGREIGEGEILMISVFDGDVKRVFTWKNVSGSQDYVEGFDDEADMIEGFCRFVREGLDTRYYTP